MKNKLKKSIIRICILFIILIGLFLFIQYRIANAAPPQRAGNVFRNITPETDSTYNIGQDTLEWLYGWFDNLRIGNSTTTNATTTGSLSVDGDTFKVDASSNFVGFGTAVQPLNTVSHQIYFLMDANKDILIDGTTNPREIDTGVMRFEHLPTIDNTRALTVNVDNNNREDTHVLVVNFDADRMNETASMYDVNVDTTGATAGVVRGYEISQVGSKITVVGLHANPGIDPISQNSGLFTSVESAWENAVDVTAAFNSDSTDVELFSADNDVVYIGMNAVFNSVEVILAIDASGAGIKPTFAVSNGSGGWTAFIPTDNTRGFRDSGIIEWFVNPSPWGTDTVNGVSKFWFRIIRTAVALTIAPTEDTIQVQTTILYLWNKDGDLKVRNATTTGHLIVGNTNPPNELGVGDLFVGGNATVTDSLSVSTLEVNDDFITDFTGTNLSVTDGILNATGGVNDWQVTSTDKIGGSLINDSLTPTTSIDIYLPQDLLVGGNATVTGNLSCKLDSSCNLGNSNTFWANIYTDKVYTEEPDWYLGQTAFAGFVGFTNIIEPKDWVGFSRQANSTVLTLSNNSDFFNLVWFDATDMISWGGQQIFQVTSLIRSDTDSLDDLGTSSIFWDEIYPDEIVLQQGTMGTTAADQTRLAGLDLSAGDAGLHVKTENDTEHLFASFVGINTTTPQVELEVDGNFGIANGNNRVGNVLCFLVDGIIGYCSDAPAGNGTCTCNNL